MDYFQWISQIRPRSTLDILWIAKESFILVDSFLLIAQFISQSEWLFCESSLFNESIKSISKTADCEKFCNCTLINCRIDSQSGLNESFCDFQKILFTEAVRMDHRPLWTVVLWFAKELGKIIIIVWWIVRVTKHSEKIFCELQNDYSC